MLESPSESLPPTPDGGLASSRPHRRPTEASLHFPSPQNTPGQSPEPLPATHVMEAPPGRNEVTRSPLTNNWHVSRPGMEAITVILHGATNLPPLNDGAVPQPFATVDSVSGNPVSDRSSTGKTEPMHQSIEVKYLRQMLQGTTLRTTSNTIPSVGIILRLIGSERPDSLLASANPSLLPTLDSKPLSENGGSPPLVPPLSWPSKSNEEEEGSPASPPTDWSTQPQPQQQQQQQHQHQPQPQPQHPLQLELQRDGLNLPSYDALTEILPEYEHLFRAPISTKGGQDQRGGPKPHRQDPPLRQDYPGEQDHTNRQAPHGQHKVQDPDQDPLSLFHSLRSPHKNRDPVRDPVYDSHAAEVIEHESRELENYRTAMRKMAEDIIALRRHVGNLESDNSKLRSELTLHQDLGKTLLDDTDIDVMTKAEITDRIASLKFKLASGTAEVKTHKDKIQQLQNELIRKNDREKELLCLQRAHQQQQAVLQRYQDRAGKAKSLEGTIRQQEKVIEKMEKVLDTKLKEKNRDQTAALKKQTGGSSDNLWKEIESALASENSRLRAELEKLRYQSAPSPFQQPLQVLDTKLKEKNRDQTAALKKQTGGSSDNLWKEIESALASENSRLRAELEKLRYQSAPSPFQQPLQVCAVLGPSQQTVYSTSAFPI
ncbi:Coiled-coil domain-containing protein 33 [Acipenser ruthenus]|uniref:Coiled-coil domain-containing protein 33 n=1 Tax=Acipenser ruthenus TaxID=7906 RepID=A0A662YPB9_ACIRT|nr:Coiled-coil domain-containing protein 33 [Acipenser ruthenus]